MRGGERRGLAQHKSYEPRQVLAEAAISMYLCVPRGCRSGAVCCGNTYRVRSKSGALHKKTLCKSRVFFYVIVFLVKMRPLASLEFFVAAECPHAHLTPKNSAQR